MEGVETLVGVIAPRLRAIVPEVVMGEPDTPMPFAPETVMLVTVPLSPVLVPVLVPDPLGAPIAPGVIVAVVTAVSCPFAL
jgi:hypothetical protein